MLNKKLGKSPQRSEAQAERNGKGFPLANNVLDRIFEFDNYRQFLREYFAEQKKLKSFFSNRYFARKAGFTSPSFLSHVIEGKRNLTLESLEKLLAGMELTGRWAAYLKTLVRFNQTKTAKERLLVFSEMTRLRRRFSAHQLDISHYAYFTAWYFPDLRELAVPADWKGNYKVLASMLRPPISAEKAKKAVETLLELGLLEQQPDGTLSQASQAVLADDVPKSVRRQFRMEMLMRGMEALEKAEPDSRGTLRSQHISGATVAMSEKSFQDLSAMMDEFRKKVLEIAVEDEKVERIYQFSFLAFPLSGRMEPTGPSGAGR